MRGFLFLWRTTYRLGSRLKRKSLGKLVLRRLLQTVIKMPTLHCVKAIQNVRPAHEFFSSECYPSAEIVELNNKINLTVIPNNLHGSLDC